MIIIDRVIVENESAHQDRAMLDLEKLFVLEDSGMCALFQMWRELRLAGTGVLPSMDDVTWQPIVDMGMHMRVSLVDLTADEPTAYKLKMQAISSYQHNGNSLRDVHFADYTDRLQGEGMQRDYLSVKARGQPRYHHIHSNVNGRWRAYRRLILPFASQDGTTVDGAMVAVRHAAPESWATGDRRALLRR